MIEGDVGVRRCAGCGQDKPLEAFARHRYSRDGRRNRCRECEAAPTEEGEEIPEGHKRCAGCERVLPLSSFREQPGKTDGRRSRCKPCEGDQRARRRAERRARQQVERERLVAEWLEAGEKPCAACGEVKPLDAYWRRKDSLDGHGTTCKACLRTRRNAPDPEDEDRVERWATKDDEFAAQVEAERRRLEGRCP